MRRISKLIKTKRFGIYSSSTTTASKPCLLSMWGYKAKYLDVSMSSNTDLLWRKKLEYPSLYPNQPNPKLANSNSRGSKRGWRLMWLNLFSSIVSWLRYSFRRKMILSDLYQLLPSKRCNLKKYTPSTLYGWAQCFLILAKIFQHFRCQQCLLANF